MAQAIAGASRPARTAASRPGPVALEGPRARDAASLAGAGAGSGPRGGDGARPGEGKNEDRTAPEELKEEEEEEPEAVVAATVTVRFRFIFFWGGRLFIACSTGRALVVLSTLYCTDRA